MNTENQDQENIEGMSTDHTKVDTSKRKFSKVGLTVAPVIMTLASKPVFAAQGLSNMISGNASGCNGDIFEGGFSLADWKVGAEGPTYDNAMWVSAVNSSYSSVTVDAAFSGHILPSTAGSLLIDIIKNSEPGWEIVLGYLNLMYYIAESGTYFLTIDQFWALNDGDTAIWDIINTPYSTFSDLIISNVGKAPGDICIP